MQKLASECQYGTPGAEVGRLAGGKGLGDKSPGGGKGLTTQSIQDIIAALSKLTPEQLKSLMESQI